ncbi:uncharacterized protein FFNC_15492 [Fusarium fujikuroi]
MCYS